MKKGLILCSVLAGCFYDGRAQDEGFREHDLPNPCLKDSLPEGTACSAERTGKQVYNSGHLLVARVPRTYRGHLLVRKPADNKGTILRIQPPEVCPEQLPRTQKRVKSLPRKHPWLRKQP